MLVLSRQRDQSIMIGEDIEVSVVDVRGDKVRLGVNAPRTVSVHRKEVFDQIRGENKQSAQLSPNDLPIAARPAVPQAKPPLRLAVLVSGGGTTLQNLLDQSAAGKLPATVAMVIASRGNIGAIGRAEKAGVPVVVIDRAGTPDAAAFSRAVFDACDAAKVDLVCMAGWLSLLVIPPAYEGRAMNIHPALLPSFGGRGMYGERVHTAVLAAGCKVSGCTVHFVDNTCDAGPIILQRTCPVNDDDTATTLATRVFEEEKTAYTQAIRLYQAGRLKIVSGRVRVG